MSALTSWRTLLTSADRNYMVKGHEIADCFYLQHRFRIAEVRVMIPDNSFSGYYMSVRYSVYDAHRVSDAEVRAGKFAPRVGSFDTFEEAITFCDEQHKISA